MRGASLAVLLTLALAWGSPPASAYPRPGRTERVSVAKSGAEGNAQVAFGASISLSGDGRFVAFAGDADNLVPGDGNADGICPPDTWHFTCGLDVFVRDRVAGATERVSIASDGTEANGASRFPSISRDGRYVSFVSYATNLVQGDVNEMPDVFVHDRSTGTTERIVIGPQGPFHGLIHPKISGDGRFVGFISFHDGLIQGDTNGGSDVFIHDRVTRVLERVSVANDGSQAVGDSFNPVLSFDGRFVAFDSTADNLVSGDTQSRDVFVRDRLKEITERVSVTSEGAEAAFDFAGRPPNCYAQGISDDGNIVAFMSNAYNLVPRDDTGANEDIFVHDRLTRRTERVSTPSVGETPYLADMESHDSSVSADGRFVAFRSKVPTLVPGDANGVWDVFVHDRLTAATERVSVGEDGQEAGDGAWFGLISADGRSVAFTSPDGGLVPFDGNEANDAFVRDLGPAIGPGQVNATASGGEVSVNGWARLSGSVLESSTDPTGDAGLSESAGTDLIGARLIARPEEEDLMVQLDLASLPGPKTNLWWNGYPVIYGIRFRADGILHEVRGTVFRLDTQYPTKARATFSLFRCEPGCAEVGSTPGSIGGAGVYARFPLDIDPGVRLSGITAFTTLGTKDASEPVDEVAIAAITVPGAVVAVAIAPAGTPKSEVSFHDVPVEDGRFAAWVDGVSSGAYDVWAQACVADACQAVRVRLEVG